MRFENPNSVDARDIAYLVHPQTNLAMHNEIGPAVMTRGEGVYITDDQGNQYLEAASGLWCASLGFSNERLARTAYQQMRTLGYYHIYWHYSHGKSVDLAEKLVQIAPVPMSKVLFQCSGSEANDAAIKLAWYYQNAIGKPDKRKIIGRRMGYHGSTCAAISASGKSDMHAEFNLPFAQFLHTELPHYYRMHVEGETEEQFATRIVDALEALIVQEGPDTVAAFIAEPVIGAGGAILPPVTYFEKVQAVLKRYEILFIVDEVICAFGRTGRMWGSQTFALNPDLITCAKALSAGMQPISALLISEPVYQAMLLQSRKLGSFAHGATYAGHPVAAAVALETLTIYDEMDMLGHVGRVGAYMQNALGRFADHPLVGDVRGVGLLTGLELMRDKRMRTPFDPTQRIGAVVTECAKRHGLLVRVIGDRIALSPPLIITEAEIDELSSRLGRTLDEVQDAVGDTR